MLTSKSEEKINLLKKEIKQLKKSNLDYVKRIAVLVEREESLQQSFREIATLHRLSEKVSSTHEINQILNTFLDVVKEILDYKSAALWFWQGVNKYQLLLGRNLNKYRTKEIDSQIEKGFFDWTISQRKPVIIPAITRNKSYILAPLIIGKEVIGILYLETLADTLTITQQHFQMISLLTNQAAIAILNARLYQELLEKTAAVTLGKNFLESVLASMSDIILVFDHLGKAVRVNERGRQFFALGSAEIEGKAIAEILPKEVAGFYSNLVELANKEEKVFVEQIDYQSPEGNLPLEVLVSPWKDAQGEKRGVITVCRDLAERIELLELKRIDKIKSELISGISHELRTPLTSIRAGAEILLDNLANPDPELQKNYLEIICEQSNRLNFTITNFLELALLESNERVFSRGETTPQTIVKLALDNPDLGKGNIETYFEENLPALSVDDFELSLALANLLHNGLKFSLDNKKVRLEVVKKEKDKQIICCFRVMDWGIGIEEKYFVRLTEKLFRVDNSFTAETSGLGIGLAVVRKIAEAHKGWLEIESTPKKGSVFTICIPIKT